MSLNKNKYIPVTCKTCNTSWDKRQDSIQQWDGNCRSCAMKEMTSRPEIKQLKSELARVQVIKQGGIPNGNRFTTEQVSGERNCNWKGGITPENVRLRHSEEYRQWRSNVFIRDHFTCVLCGQVGGSLQADHIKPWSLFPELRHDVSNGRTMCKACHDTYGWRPWRDQTWETSNGTNWYEVARTLAL